MCGRYVLSVPDRWIARTFKVPEPLLPFDLAPRYNIAPTQQVLAVRRPSPEASREAVLLKWGLVPPWAKDAKIGVKHINARSETVAEKPSFRSAFRKRRCLVPADGFFEWQKLGKQKQPYLFTVGEGGLFAFAGLWEEWEGGEVIESCSILTTAANELVRPLHDRMPVILGPDDYDRWLDPEVQQTEAVEPLLKPYPARLMAAQPVSQWVNNARHEGPQCVEPVPA